MSAMPASPLNVSGEPGYLMLLRGQPFAGYSPGKHGPLWNYRLLPGRAGDAGTVLFQLIYDRTWSARDCPQWASIPLREFCEYVPHKSGRAIRSTLDFLVKIHLIERDPKDRWRFKTHPENVEHAPLLMPVRHPNAAAKKRQARAARMSAPTLTAALRSGPNVHDPSQPPPFENGRTGPTAGPDTETCLIVESVESGSNGAVLPVGFSPAELKHVSPFGDRQTIEAVSVDMRPEANSRTVSSEAVAGTTRVASDQPGTNLADACGQEASQDGSVAELKQVSPHSEPAELKPVSIVLKQVTEVGQSVSAEGAVTVPPDETYCPWEWRCPFLHNDLAGHKPLIQIIQSLQAGRSTGVVEEDADRPAARDELEKIRKLLLDELSDILPGDMPSDDLCHRIHRAMAGCPLEFSTQASGGTGLLSHRIRQRWSTIKSFGFVELLAGDVGKYWQENRIKVLQQEQESRVQTENHLIERVQDSFSDLHGSFQALKWLANTVA